MSESTATACKGVMLPLGPPLLVRCSMVVAVQLLAREVPTSVFMGFDNPKVGQSGDASCTLIVSSLCLCIADNVVPSAETNAYWLSTERIKNLHGMDVLVEWKRLQDFHHVYAYSWCNSSSTRCICVCF